ncbi:MAG: alpha/beta hydrolase [Deltaproteobacteria bacterium]|nr:MAG: alpha/beta hydrolase [Deltaproteobacteria bacterium]
MKPVKVEERRATAFDGTDLAYHVVGEGPPILLANGLGGSWRAFKHQISYFGDRHRFISWDYRGLYRSGPPVDRGALRIEDQVRDAITILDAEGVESAVVFGWSMGVQLSLELFRVAQGRLQAMVLMNGVAGRPYESVLGIPAMQHIVPPILRGARTMPSLVEAVTRRMVSWPETVSWAKRLGLASKTLDDDLFRELAGSFEDLDMEIYLHTLELLGDHDAWDVLEDVDIPTLIVAGDRDAMTPRRASEAMVRRIPGAELMVVPGGTHYVAVEYPELVNLRVEKFFRERGVVGQSGEPR